MQADSSIIFTREPDKELRSILKKLGSPKVMTVTDSTVYPLCGEIYPVLNRYPCTIIKAGEENKNIDSLQTVWEAMHENHFHRNDVVVNLGGGMVSDLGGFAAATYMRGIRYINLPTTLLSAVDASCGGKTAINFEGIKNLIGAFHFPSSTIICPQAFASLPKRELLSGWGEIIKHAIIDSQEHLDYVLSLNPFELTDEEMLSLIRRSVEVKRAITTKDPKENGLRRALNLGHTAAHAIESVGLSRGLGISHGHAVALGLLAEINLSSSFPKETFKRLSNYIHRLFSHVEMTEDDIPILRQAMLSDKKNLSKDNTEISFVSMESVGKANVFAETKVENMINSLFTACNFHI